MIHKLTFILAAAVALGLGAPDVRAAGTSVWWNFQSVDTMKYSRDLSLEKLNDPAFDAVIDQQMKDIAAVGATHVGIATPYDEQFSPILDRWVTAARRHNLKVWFRGNWAGWEGWFGYPRISRAEHIKKTEQFILAHKDLFSDGDIFSACPECENGGPGDPRRINDAAGHRQFLIKEYSVTKAAFRKIGKKVPSNYASMNADVARLVMDTATTKALDGVVTIDHYVAEPAQIAKDIEDIAAHSGGKIVLGEWGAPIPDIHGSMSEKKQAEWIANALRAIYQSPNLIGVNYWVNVGGSTQLWHSVGTPRLAVRELKKYFQPAQLRGVVKNERGRPVAAARVTTRDGKSIETDAEGIFKVPRVAGATSVAVSADTYQSADIAVGSEQSEIEIILPGGDESFFFNLRTAWHRWWNFIF